MLLLLRATRRIKRGDGHPAFAPHGADDVERQRVMDGLRASTRPHQEAQGNAKYGQGKAKEQASEEEKEEFFLPWIQF